jgi:uncharacterized RDD family membrane protein YckC
VTDTQASGSLLAGTQRQAPGRRGHPAGLVTRAVAYVIDAVVIAGLLSVTTFTLNAVVLLVTGDRQAVEVPDGWLVTLGSISVVSIVYLTLGWWLFGRTVGKLIMGVRVVAANGEHPRFGQSLIRALAYSLSGAVFMLGFAWIGVNPKRRAWHDHIARTWVVYDWAAHARDVYDDDPLPPLDTPIAPTC